MLPNSTAQKKAEEVMMNGQFAACLEVSGYPKPGNVHRMRDYKHKTYEDFLAGSVSLGPSLRASFLQGYKGKTKVGKLIHRAVRDMLHFQKHENTHLGIILLFIPLAVSLGRAYKNTQAFKENEVRKDVKQLIRNTTPEDAYLTSKAIAMASSTEEVGRLNEEVNQLDVSQVNRKQFEQKKRNVYDIMAKSAHRDAIARELVNNYEVSFNLGYPTLMEVYMETNNINQAIVQTFLTILAEHPDTFIAKEVGLQTTANIDEAFDIGLKKAKELSEQAQTILEKGGATTDAGMRGLKELDAKLQKQHVNPGTTADLTASSIFLALLFGLTLQ